MSTSKAPRVIGIVTGFLIICVFLLTIGGRRHAHSSGGPMYDWDHDPNEYRTGEPLGVLHRVEGDNYDASNPKSNRIKAALISLVRNEELDQLLQSMGDLERTWNSKFNYPWIFFNDKPFSNEFKRRTREATNAEVRFELVTEQEWQPPSWINKDIFDESAAVLTENKVQYASMLSYHQMCRWNSGIFYKHPALADLDFYWRVEPNVHFFCDVDYDVFRFMQDRNKTYGFTISLYDAPATLTTLWPETLKFLSTNGKYLHPNNAMEFLTDRERRPEHHTASNGYSTCHFWTNFEIADLNFWRSEAYEAYFDHLDRAGGFFYERWGDAPVHTIGVGLFADKNSVHWYASFFFFRRT